MLTADEHPFSELQGLIDAAGSGATLELEHDYILTEGDSTLVIPNEITIDGKGHTLNGNHLSTILFSNSKVTLRDITFINANCTTEFYINGNVVYGGVHLARGSAGSLIDNCTFRDNTAMFGAGVYMAGNDGVVTNSRFENNLALASNPQRTSQGGAIYWTGDNGRIENSNFTENSAKYSGGAIYFNGADNHVIVNSLFHKNVDPQFGAASGGAVYYRQSINGRIVNSNFTENFVGGSGGAVFVDKDSKNQTIIGSLFSNNTALGLSSKGVAPSHGYGGGAVYWLGRDGSIINSNFTDNTANIGGAVYYSNSNNQSITDSNFFNNTATMTGLDNTALSAPGGGAIYYYTTNDARIKNVNFTENSAFRGGAISYAKGTNVSIVDSLFSKNEANASSVASGGAIYYNTVTDSTIENVNFTENSAKKSGGAFYNLKGAGTQLITDSSFSNNSAGSGGSIYYDTTNNFMVEDSNFTENHVTGAGGAIYTKSSSNGIIDNSNFTENSAGSGGAVYYSSSSNNQKITGSSFLDNTADGSYGGAVYYGSSNNGIIELSEFTGNSAKTSGGAVYYTSSNNQTIRESKFSKNAANGTTSSGGGGAVYYSSSKNGCIEDSEFKENVAAKLGGAVCYYGTANTNQTISSSNFTNNAAKGTTTSNGGAIYWGSPDGTVKNSEFTENSAQGSGGAICVNSANNHLISGSTFSNNAANGSTSSNGGAVFYTNGKVTNARIDKSEFTENTARGYGGAVYYYKNANSVNQSITDSNFTNNIAVTYDGGAVYWASPNGTVNNCNFNENSAKRSGGAIYYDKDANNQLVTGSSFLDNTANGTGSNGGGAIYYGASNNQSIEDSKFNGNNATSGSAIYHNSGSLDISSTELLENQARASSLTANAEVDLFDVTIHTEFKGRDNILNGIYSAIPTYVNFTDVTYWGANGKMNTGASTVTPVASADVSDDGNLVYTDAREAGINITVSIYDENGVFVKNITASTNIYGDINFTESRFVPGKYKAVAIHKEDKYYTELSKEFTFEVPKANSTIMADNVTVVYDSDVVLVASGENATGVNSTSIVVLDANGNVVSTATVSVDGFKITIGGLIPGNYSVKYTNTVNETLYNTANNVTGVIVLKANSTIMADNVTVVYDGDVVLEASGENATGIDADSVVVLDADGNVVSTATVSVDGFKITIGGLVPGNYTVKYNNTVNETLYNPANNVTGVRVLKANSTIMAENQTVVYNSDVVLEASGENATGIDADSVVVLDANGNVVSTAVVSVDGFKITISGLVPGNYTVKYNNTVNETLYNLANNVTGVRVLKANSTIMAENQTVVYNSDVVLNAEGVNATGIDADSVVVLDANGNPVDGATVTVDGFKITIKDLIPGNYTVKYNNTVNESLYNPANNVTGVRVLKANSTIMANNVTVVYNSDVVLNAEGVNATGIDQTSVEVLDVDGNPVVGATVSVNGFVITISNLGAGDYTVKYNNTVNETLYNPANNVTGIRVLKAPSTVNGEDVVANFGDEISMPISSVNATGVTYEIVDGNGNVVGEGTVGPEGPIVVSGLAAGDYAVKLATVVDDNHTSVSNTSKIHVKHVYYIVLDPVVGYTGDIVNILAHVTDETGNPVNGGTAQLTIKYDDRMPLGMSEWPVLNANEGYSANVNNGEAVFANIKLGEPGLYPDVVVYSGDDGDPVENESTVTILKLNTTVKGDDVSGKPDDKKDIPVDVLDQKGNPVKDGNVTLTLNGNTYSASVKDGKAVFKDVVLPNPGDYKATISYNGTDIYNPSNSTINVHVDKVNTNPSADDISGKKGEKRDITVKIVDENGNPVKNGTATLKIGDNSYTADVVDGVAIFKDVVLPSDDAVAEVYYHGNDYYNASSTTFKIDIIKDSDEPDDNNTDDDGTDNNGSTNSRVVDTRATGNPIAILLLVIVTLVSNRVYNRKK